MPLSLSPVPARLARLGVLDLSDDHLRVLFDDAYGRGDLSSADVALSALSHRRTEVGEEDWWIARRRCLDDWERLGAILPEGDLARRLARVTAARLEREVAHAWAAAARDRGAAPELRVWVTVDRTRGAETARIVRTLLQVPEGEDVYPIAITDPAAIHDQIAEILEVVPAAPSRRN